jgi:transcriptional regulator with XRE-family HTH domain
VQTALNAGTPEERSARLADNLVRIAGMHRLRTTELAAVLGIGRQTVSQWVNGHNSPNLRATTALQRLFEIDAMNLSETPFVELLPQLADKRRFERVEKRIRDVATRNQ